MKKGDWTFFPPETAEEDSPHLYIKSETNEAPESWGEMSLHHAFPVCVWMFWMCKKTSKYFCSTTQSAFKSPFFFFVLDSHRSNGQFVQDLCTRHEKRSQSAEVWQLRRQGENVKVFLVHWTTALNRLHFTAKDFANFSAPLTSQLPCIFVFSCGKVFRSEKHWMMRMKTFYYKYKNKDNFHNVSPGGFIR